ncbi:GNAT family N-acetyltransferase [Rhodococcus sp. Q]|uniref:GNAT family N-acetyltransferase n=1 Tax=Rhodococcus sp. Q TaxID=2502252 RepID=UPI002016212F|nr:GNAT family N-acetyltransferase [Rhodococcus sp. Q]
MHGWSEHESEIAMVAALSEVPALSSPGELRVETVTDEAGLRDYASLMAANWTPPSVTVPQYFAGVSSAVLSARCASTFVVGYVGDRPVSGAEIHVSDGVVGLYGVVTLDDARRRGYGTAVTLHALDRSRQSGLTTAVLQASAEGASVYARIGFTSVGGYTEFAL